jgi:phage tail sheath protein FI
MQNPIPAGVTTLSNYNTSSGSVVTEFSLENLSPLEADGTRAIDTRNGDIGLRKFTVPFQGGFDGHAPHIERTLGAAIIGTNTQGFDLSGALTSGSAAYKKAVDSISNPESYDINLLTIPGANYEQHPYIVDYALEKMEERQDCFYILDLASWGATVDTVISQAALVDSNYAAGYYPWIKVLDTNSAQFLWAPPSVVLPEVYAYNDNVAAEWFAPAGLNRGGIPGAQKVKSRLPIATRDELYENKVNPIATFPGVGIVAWGQKTLQDKASALDRINVRRLLIALKKFIASSSKFLVFEQNTEATRNRFLSIVNPYLASVQERQGLHAFRVVMDETNNTPDVIDRNILKGEIYLQPTKTAEFIILDFNILPTGATFPTG